MPVPDSVTTVVTVVVVAILFLVIANKKLREYFCLNDVIKGSDYGKISGIGARI